MKTYHKVIFQDMYYFKGSSELKPVKNLLSPLWLIKTTSRVFTKTEKLTRFAEVQKNWYLLPAGNLLYKGRMKIMGNNENVKTQIVIREIHSSGIS